MTWVIMGAKADASLISGDAENCIVEAEFDVDPSDEALREELDENGVEWDNGHLITLAEVEDGVYQFTGVAGEGTDTTMGVRWQYDAELSFKFFGQAGWGAEWGTVTLTDEAKKWLDVYGNVELIKVDESGTRQPLELGATYVMTVTECTPLDADSKFNCTIDFRKL